MQPIIEFKSKKQLSECLAYWKKRLFLDNWIITASVVALEDLNLNNVVGECNVIVQCNTCSIRILRKQDYPAKCLVRYCAEATLVHELLHCKYNWLEPPQTAEGLYMDEMEHSLIEQMAKSLIMIKYGLTPSWFRNRDA